MPVSPVKRRQPDGGSFPRGGAPGAFLQHGLRLGCTMTLPAPLGSLEARRPASQGGMEASQSGRQGGREGREAGRAGWQGGREPCLSNAWATEESARSFPLPSKMRAALRQPGMQWRRQKGKRHEAEGTPKRELVIIGTSPFSGVCFVPGVQRVSILLLRSRCVPKCCHEE